MSTHRTLMFAGMQDAPHLIATFVSIQRFTV